MTVFAPPDSPMEHPVDAVERFATANEWAFERGDDDEISISVEGACAPYHLAFTWLADIEALHGACAFELAVPSERRAEVLALVALVNAQLWVGHFDLWSDDKVIMFRHSLLLTDGRGPSPNQCELLTRTVVETCERYYQAFLFVVGHGKDARTALDSVLFETVGQA
jgi:hypothetical protein